MPSASQAMSLAAGWNRFGFTGQWLIDFDVYVKANSGDQALIGNWAHAWHPSNEQAQFQAAQGRTFRERQNILRVRSRGALKTCILPYAKEQEFDRGQVETADDAEMTIRWKDGSVVTVLRNGYAYTGKPRTIITATEGTRVAFGDIVLSGGPIEFVLESDSAQATIHGPSGQRQIALPGLQKPITLEYEGGPPHIVLLERNTEGWAISSSAGKRTRPQ